MVAHMKSLVRITLALALTLALAPAIALFATPRAHAGASGDIMYVTGTEGYDQAREMLDIVNAERRAAGLSSLVLDEELTQVAMQRAAEQMFYGAHVRPDGTSCFTAFPSTLGMRGENVCVGATSASQAMKWLFYNERDLYNAGERDDAKVGHYLNMMSGAYTSIGIGCWNGTYWVQNFSSIPSAKACDTTGTVEKTRGIKVDYGTCVTEQGIDLDGSIGRDTLAVGTTYRMQYQAVGQAGVIVDIDPQSATWTSSNPAVLSVDANGVVTAQAAGDAVITATLPSGKSGSYVWKVTDTVPSQVMYRLYNPNSGEHFYTASVYERDQTEASGWTYEGEGWTAPEVSNTPVYRLYSGTDHHYCTSENERDTLVDVGWTYEGIGWYSDDGQGVPLYRQFNPNVDPTASFNNSGSHNYTIDLNEHRSLVAIGWHDEGIGWYGVK